MKEVTEWSGSPRLMWVWDNSVKHREKRTVFGIFNKRSENCGPVLVIDASGVVYWYRHCAEIEEDIEMATHKQLARWLRARPDRELKYSGDGDVYSVHVYDFSREDESMSKDTYVREGDGPWMVAFKDVLEALG